MIYTVEAPGQNRELKNEKYLLQCVPWAVVVVVVVVVFQHCESENCLDGLQWVDCGQKLS